jgi:hypothetical protein
MLSLRISFILCLLPLTACSFLSAKAEYIPDNEVLDDATIGEPYFLKINILGGAVFGGMKRSAGVVEPNDAGVFLRNCRLPDSVITTAIRDTKDHNCVEIYGTPNKLGVVKIKISGGMYGNMFVPTSYFSKDYTLKINQL